MTGDTKRRFLSRLIFTFFGVILLFSFQSNASVNGAKADTLFRRTPGTVTPKGPYRPERTKKSDILYTRLDVQFDWVKQQVPASAILKFKSHFYPQNVLELDAKDLTIKGISLLDTTEIWRLTTEEIAGKVKKKLEFTYDKRKLIIKLGQEYTRKDTLFVKIDYIAKPNDVPRGKAGDSASDKGLIFYQCRRNRRR
jgi:aminopeptidase N